MRRQHELGVDVELVAHLGLPLLGEVRRAEDGEPLDLAPVEQLAGDEQRLDRLADADVVGDQQPDRVQLQRHQQRHELVRARLDGDAAEGAERPGARAEAEPDARRGAAGGCGSRRRRCRVGQREAWPARPVSSGR